MPGDTAVALPKTLDFLQRSESFVCTSLAEIRPRAARCPRGGVRLLRAERGISGAEAQTASPISADAIAFSTRATSLGFSTR